MRPRSRFVWLLALAFALGCVTASVVQIPRARADGPPIPRWEHWCLDVDGVPKLPDLDRAGKEGWELVAVSFRPPVVANGNSVGGGATNLCFKRPR